VDGLELGTHIPKSPFPWHANTQVGAKLVQLKIGRIRCHNITKQLDDNPFSTKKVANKKL
jgi:hypothetical protein